MKNFIQDGNVLSLTAPTGGVVSGTAYKVGSVVVVAATTEAQATPFEGLSCGVFSLPVTAAEAPTEGAKAYFKANNTISITLTSNTLVGVFLSAKDADGNALVKLTGQIAV